MRFIAAVGFCATLTVACGEQPSAPAPGAVTDPAAPPSTTSLQQLQCTARVDLRQVTCGSPGSGGLGDLIVGNQGVYVQLTSSNVNYNAGTGLFSFDVTVQNRIPQGLGTVNGTSADPAGVQVFFFQAPTVTSGTGTASVANADGTGTFTASNQPYFAYTGSELGADGILSNTEVSSSKNWVFNIPSTANTFTFQVYVNAKVQYPNGYVDAASPSPYLNQAATQSVTATSRTAVGNAVAGSTLSYASSAPAIATVDPSTGVVTAVAPGVATINVTSSESTTGAVTVQVCPNLAVGEVYTVDGAAGQDVCFGGGGSAQEYTMLPMNVSSSASISLSITGTGIQAVTGPPSPVLIPSESVSPAGLNGGTASLSVFGDMSSSYGHIGDPESSGIPRDALQRLRSRDKTRASARDELEGEENTAAQHTSDAEGVITEAGAEERLRWYPTESTEGTVMLEEGTKGAGAVALSRTMPADPVVGTLVNYNTNSACSGSPSIRTGMVRSVKSSVVIVSDTLNPAGGFTTAQYDSIALEFDSIPYSVVTTNFGAPTDVDNNGRIILFYTRE